MSNDMKMYHKEFKILSPKSFSPLWSISNPRTVGRLYRQQPSRIHNHKTKKDRRFIYLFKASF